MNVDLANWLLILLLSIVGYAAMVGWWAAALALLPSWVDTSGRALTRSPFRACLVGAAPWMAAMALAAGLHQRGLTVAILCGPITLGFIGSAPLALRIGKNLASPGTPQWHPGLRGAMLLALLPLLPFIGWFIMLPLLLITGTGAALLGLRRHPDLLPATAQEVDAKVS